MNSAGAIKTIQVGVVKIRWWVKGGVVPSVKVELQPPDRCAVIERLEGEIDSTAVAYQWGGGGLLSLRSSRTARERDICDAVTAPSAIRNAKVYADCGAKSTLTVLATFDQGIFSACTRADPIAVRRAGPQRWLSP